MRRDLLSVAIGAGGVQIAFFIDGWAGVGAFGVGLAAGICGLLLGMRSRA